MLLFSVLWTNYYLNGLVFTKSVQIIWIQIKIVFRRAGVEPATYGYLLFQFLATNQLQSTALPTELSTDM